jgi:predicted site-specific integrase-resolvase
MTSAELLNQEEAAAALGLSPKTLEKWRSTGMPKLPFVRLNSAVRYRMKDIEKFIDDAVVGGEVPTKQKRERRKI